MAGDDITVVDSEERAKMLSSGRQAKLQLDRLRKLSEENTATVEPSEEEFEMVELPIRVKAVVQGTVQAVTDALKTLNSSQVHQSTAFYDIG